MHPPFSITPKILDEISRIERLIGRIESFDQPKPQPYLRKSNRVRTVQGSLAIEGNTLNLEQITALLEGKTVVGKPSEIKEVFKVTGVGKVAGCLVTEGVARRSAGVRLLRDNVVIHEGTLKTLKRFKDEVAEVQSGQECGMAFENYDDIRADDVIEIFEREEITRVLD